MSCFVGKEPQISKSISPRHPDGGWRECELPWKPRWVQQAEAFKVPSLECPFLSDREILTFRWCLICFRIVCVSLSLKRVALIAVIVVHSGLLIYLNAHTKKLLFHRRYMFDIYTNDHFLASYSSFFMSARPLWHSHHLTLLWLHLYGAHVRNTSPMEWLCVKDIYHVSWGWWESTRALGCLRECQRPLSGDHMTS